jgi:hypothetical protein
MFGLTTHEFEFLIDLTEIKMMAMSDANYCDETEIASLKSCQTKLLKIAIALPGVALVPFDEVLAN